MTLCMRRLPHLSRAEFHRFWSEEHPKAAVADAAEVLGIRRYIRVFALSEELNEALRTIRGGEVDFDGVAEIWLDGVDDYLERWRVGPGLEVVKAFLDDERNFVDWTRSVFFLGEEEIVIG